MLQLFMSNHQPDEKSINSIVFHNFNITTFNISFRCALVQVKCKQQFRSEMRIGCDPNISVVGDYFLRIVENFLANGILFL